MHHKKSDGEDQRQQVTVVKWDEHYCTDRLSSEWSDYAALLPTAPAARGLHHS